LYKAYRVDNKRTAKVLIHQCGVGMKWLEWIVKTYVDWKLQRVRKKAKEERPLALKLV